MSRPIPVSLRARGLLLFNPQTAFDPKYQATAMLRELTDISVAMLISMALLSWSAWFSALLALLSTVFFSKYHNGEVRMDGTLWMPFCFLLFLPLLWLVHQGYTRRQQALADLATVKATAVCVFMLYKALLPGTASSDGKLQELKDVMTLLLDDMQQYFQHPRPYAKHFMLVSLSQTPTQSLHLISREVGILLRRLHRDLGRLFKEVQSLQSYGVADAQVASLLGHVTALQAVMERLSSHKEFRTPIALRAMLCAYGYMVVPVFLGPFFCYTVVGGNYGTIFGIINAIVIQVMLASLMTLATNMEDPFDDGSPDMLSFYEAKDHILFMMSEDADAEALPDVSAAFTAVTEQQLRSVKHSSQEQLPVTSMPPMPNLNLSMP